MRSDFYQVVLIFLGVVVTALWVFLYREFFPNIGFIKTIISHSKNFRSTYTGEPPPDFKQGVKQIVIEGTIRALRQSTAASRATSLCKFPIFPRPKWRTISTAI